MSDTITPKKLITPAVLVTGSDNRGNEFSFFKSGGTWLDCYNETPCTDKWISEHVFPNVRKVYFADVVMTGAEWVTAGCPLELVSDFIEPAERKASADVIAEKYEAEFMRLPHTLRDMTAQDEGCAQEQRKPTAREIALDENGNLRPYSSYKSTQRGKLVGDYHEIHSYTWDGE